MTDLIQDTETMSEEPQSIDTTPTAMIVHHNGSEMVRGFASIEEIDAEERTVRVWYDGVDTVNYNDYYNATITEVNL